MAETSEDHQASIAMDDTSAASVEEKRSKFGTRYLTDPKSVFQHNAWDNVTWDEEQEATARDIVIQQSQKAVSQEKRDEYEREAATHWNKFYGVHSNHFFKDRHWLFTEFPELYGSCSQTHVSQEERKCSKDLNLVEETSGLEIASEINDCNETTAEFKGIDSNEGQSAATVQEEELNQAFPEAQKSLDQDLPFKLLEVGCGVGNTVFPVLKTNRNPNLMVYCCDFSSTAIDIVKAHPDYDNQRCHAFVYDITDESAEVPIAEGSLDVIVMIFVLSAVCPEKMQAAVNRLASYLKVGGMFLFRDYGRYDMAQLRFKEGRCLSENFYVRGDGTRVYFFTQDELRNMFQKAGLVERENLIDRRLQVNRGRQLKMYRVWIQCKYIKS